MPSRLSKKVSTAVNSGFQSGCTTILMSECTGYYFSSNTHWRVKYIKEGEDKFELKFVVYFDSLSPHKTNILFVISINRKSLFFFDGFQYKKQYLTISFFQILQSYYFQFI